MPYCTINKINFFYQEKGSGEPLVFLHGLGSSSDDWQQQIEYYSKKYRVIAIDCRGHGRSEITDEKYTIPLFAKDITQILVVLNISCLHLVGFSMGGMIAFQMAIDAPSRIKSLTIINSGPGLTHNLWLMKTVVTLRIWVIHLMGMARLGKMISKKLFPKKSQEHLVERFIDSMKNNSKSAYIRSLRAFLIWDVTHKLASLDMPVLIVAAEHDYTSVDVKKSDQTIQDNK